MAYYPGATRRLLPEDATQPRMVPVRVIFHTAVGETSPRSTFARAGCGKESHLWTGRDVVEQYVTTDRTADAQWAGNPDSISVESADNGDPAHDPWTPWQLEQNAQILAWAHGQHGIPLRACESHTDAGVGYHRQFVEWNRSNHSCPGDARVKQIPQIIARAREIVAGANTPQEDDVQLTDPMHHTPTLARELGDDADTVQQALSLAAAGGKAARKLPPAVTRLAADVAVLRKAVAALGAGQGLDPTTLEAMLKRAAEDGARELLHDLADATGVVDPPQGA